MRAHALLLWAAVLGAQQIPPNIVSENVPEVRAN